LAAAMMSVAILSSLEPAGAIDPTSADECKNVFPTKAQGEPDPHSPRFPSFMAGDSSLSRTGWSDGPQDARLRRKKDDGQTVNIVASCATDIMLSSVQFELNVVNPDKIRRLFPRWRTWKSFAAGVRFDEAVPFGKIALLLTT
jgi:hypothetical protein